MLEILSSYWPNLIVAVLAIAILVWVIHISRPRFPKGEAAPNMTFKMIDDSPAVSLRSLRGKPIVLDFWESWCGPCQNSLPFMNELAVKYQDKVHFIAVNAGDEELATQTAFRDRIRLTLPIATNGRQAAAGVFEIKAIPWIVVLDSHGKLVESFPSGNPAAEVEEKLISLMSK